MENHKTITLIKLGENKYKVEGLMENSVTPHVFNNTVLKGTPEQIYFMISGCEPREGDISNG